MFMFFPVFSITDLNSIYNVNTSHCWRSVEKLDLLITLVHVYTLIKNVPHHLQYCTIDICDNKEDMAPCIS